MDYFIANHRNQNSALVIIPVIMWTDQNKALLTYYWWEDNLV